MSVVAELRVGKRLLRFTRAHNPGTLTVSINRADPERIEQQVVDDMVGMDYSCFISCVLMGQFNRFFFDLSPTEKLAVFSDALRLNVWQEASKAAEAHRKAAQAEVDEFERRVCTLDGRLSGLQSQRKDLRKFIATMKVEARTKVEEIDKKLQQVEQTIDHLREVSSNSGADVGKAQDTIEAFNAKLLTAGDTCRALDKEVSKIEHEIKHAKDERKDLVGKHNKLGTVIGSECPYCLTEITGKRAKAARQKLKGSVEWVELELSKLRDRLKAKKTELRKAEKAKSKIDRKLTKAEAELEQLKRDRYQHKSKLSNLERDASDLRGKKQQAETKLQDEQDRLARLVAQMKTTKRERAKAQAALNAAMVKAHDYDYWRGGFKNIRLWLIEGALRELEVEVNSNLVELGLKGWEVSFDIERETQSGTISKGFSVFISSPKSNGPVQWEAWSGGETQRLRIAGAAGLASLVASRRGVDVGLEVWDEPTAHLSESGIDSLLAFLESRAYNNGRQVWIVDHRSLDSGTFDGQAMVVKDSRGSIIHASL
jgi:DNA repair exonuclease SbcCD ATPase subunit